MAQVIVGLIIAMVIEGQRVLRIRIDGDRDSQPAQLGSSILRLSERRAMVVVYLVLYLVTGSAGAIALAVCLHSAVSQSPPSAAGTALVLGSLVLQLFFVVVGPTAAIALTLGLHFGIPERWQTFFAIGVALLAAVVIAVVAYILAA